MKYIDSRMLWPTAIAARCLPFRVLPLLRFPPLSWLPGHTAAQEHRCVCDGNSVHILNLRAKRAQHALNHSVTVVYGGIQKINVLHIRESNNA